MAKFSFIRALADTLGIRSRPSLWKGFVAGAVGGVAGSAAKAAAEALYPPRTEGQPEPPALLARKVAGRPLNRREKERASLMTHYLFGTLTGGVYGALAERHRWVTAGAGTAFAAALLLCTHETSLPALGLAAPPHRQNAREQTSEALTHLVYGITVELLRNWTRRAL